MNLSQTAYLTKRLICRGLTRKPLNSSTEIRLTRLCTQRCRQCSVYEKTTDPPSLNLIQFREMMARLKDYGAFIGFISGGEATLVPDLDQMLIEAKKTFILATTLVTGLYNKSEIIRKIARVALDHDIHIQTSLDGLGNLGDNLRGVSHFADTVLNHMAWISKHRGNSRSLLYANIVMNNLNLNQVPELIRRANDLGWKTTVGMYHSLTATTRQDDELRLEPGERIDKITAYLMKHPQILNLKSYLAGVPSFVASRTSDYCAFLDAPVLATRVTIMEDGAVHLCYGDPIGNIFDQTLDEIFSSDKYKNRLNEYKTCRGCWTTCYTQRYLLIHPRSFREMMQNIKKVQKVT
ncbi:radical SAM protein [bacterium]|nr:radical SAM protein [bacterium]